MDLNKEDINELIQDQNDLEVVSNRLPTIQLSGIAFTVTALLFIYLGSRVQSYSFTIGILITEYIFILSPSLLLLKIFRFNIPSVLRLHKINFKIVPLIIGLMIGSIPIVGAINFVFMFLLKILFGDVILPEIPIPETASKLLLSLLLIGITPGICEEVLFRGIILRSFEKYGKWIALILSSFLFSILHISTTKVLGIFILGLLIGYIVIKTNSLYSGIIAHTVNNSVALIFGFIAVRIGTYFDVNDLEGLTQSEIVSMISTNQIEQLPLILIGIIGLLFLLYLLSAPVIFIICLVKLNNLFRDKIPSTYTKFSSKDLKNMIFFMPALILILFLFLMEIFTIMKLDTSIFKELLYLFKII